MVEGLYDRMELQEIFAHEGDGEYEPFAEVTTSMVNAAFRDVVDEAYEAPTSYSARRAYIQETFEQTNGNRELLRDMTLHFTEQVIRAHYVDWFTHTERSTTDAPDELPADSTAPEEEELQEE